MKDNGELFLLLKVGSEFCLQICLQLLLKDLVMSLLD